MVSMRKNGQTPWLFGVVSVVIVSFLTGCGTPIAPSLFDRWQQQREALMNTELALVEHPSGANNGEQLLNNGQSKLGTKTFDGNQNDFFVPKTTSSDDVIDFYLNLFAKQHHQSISIQCNAKPDLLELDYRYIEAAEWKDHYGYLVYVTVGHLGNHP